MMMLLDLNLTERIKNVKVTAKFNIPMQMLCFDQDKKQLYVDTGSYYVGELSRFKKAIVMTLKDKRNGHTLQVTGPL